MKIAEMIGINEGFILQMRERQFVETKANSLVRIRHSRFFFSLILSDLLNEDDMFDVTRR